MELFDKKFVHFMWDDGLQGKRCFVANYITELQLSVRQGYKGNLDMVTYSKNNSAPFQTMTGGLRSWQFAYYDPNYEAKKAFNEGKKVQVKRIDSFADWVDCDEPIWSKECCYRVKPKEEKKSYRPYKDSAEMIVDFIDRFKVKCPSYCEPLIWVKGKYTHTRFLIFAFYETFIKFNDDKPFMFKELFDDYTYLDGSPVGQR